MLSKHHENKYLAKQSMNIDKRHIREAYEKHFGKGQNIEAQHQNVLETLTDLKADLEPYCYIRRLRRRIFNKDSYRAKKCINKTISKLV